MRDELSARETLRARPRQACRAVARPRRHDDGFARTLGFHPIAEIARSIERDAKTISPEGLDLLTGQLNKALIELRRQCEGSLKLAS